MAESENELFGELVRIMARLRGEDGCPWDREQTHQSINPYFVEETYEVLEAIDEDDAGKLCEELGDVMLQVVFHARMAEEAALFQIGDVLRAINEKLVRRHPHVFGTVQADTAQEVLFNWEQIKKAERQNAKGHASLLDGVPRELPALLRAHRLQEKASRVGFDWKEARDVLAKVEEELGELRAAMESEQPDRMEAELGDLLFSLVNLSRFITVNPEEALRKTIARFIARFQYIEEELARRGSTPGQVTLAEMDALWAEAKRREASGDRGQRADGQRAAEGERTGRNRERLPSAHAQRAISEGGRTGGSGLVSRSSRYAGLGDTGLRVSARPASDGGSGRARHRHRRDAPGRGGHRDREDPGLPRPGHPLGQEDGRRHRHQDPPGAALLQGHSPPRSDAAQDVRRQPHEGAGKLPLPSEPAARPHRDPYPARAAAAGEDPEVVGRVAPRRPGGTGLPVRYRSALG